MIPSILYMLVSPPLPVLWYLVLVCYASIFYIPCPLLDIFYLISREITAHPHSVIPLTSGLLPKLESGTINQSHNATRFVFWRLHRPPGPHQFWVIIKETSSWDTMIKLPFQDYRDWRCAPRCETAGCATSIRTLSDTCQELLSSVPAKLVDRTCGWVS